ncbi:MAG: HEAT repeat domain-containing protein [Nitrospirae bacterium]|nr:HEAT repeat domain-containing protein [Nitrospirota bacterium]
MQESLDKARDPQEIRFISDAVINLYAAYVNSLLYPYNHPLISDSLKNAFICLQKVFRGKPNIRIEILEKRLMTDGMMLEGDILVFENFASWLKSKNIKALSFNKELTRRELISFHKIISTTKLNFEELSNAISEKNITGISIHSEESHMGDAGLATLHSIDDEGFIKDYVSTMFYMEKGHEDASFSPRPNGASPLDDAANIGLIKDYLSTKSWSEISEDSSLSNTNSITQYDAYKTEDINYAEYVESLIENNISPENQHIIKGIPPLDMANLLNAMLFKTPDLDVTDRIIHAYFSKASDVRKEDEIERCRLFFTRLKPSLRQAFEERYASFFNSEPLALDQKTDISPEETHGTYAHPVTNSEKDISSEQPAFVPHRTLEVCDFIYDFVTNGKAVIHDIEITQEIANLFNKSHLSQYQDGDIFNNLYSKIMKEVNEAEPYSSIIAECNEEAITDALFNVMINLIESNSLDDYAYRKLEQRFVFFIELYLEKGDFEKILEIYNSLKAYSLQGKWSAQASAMIINIFSLNKINTKLVEALRLYGRKQKDIVLRLISSLRSFLIPYLLDGLTEESNPSTRRFLITILTSVKSDVLEHIAKYLRDSRWYVLRNMLYLLRECHGHSYTPEVKNFLEHDVPIVRLEALRTLLSFQNPIADVYVIKFLKSGVFHLQKIAVKLSETYRIKTAVPHLIRLLEEKDIRAKKFLLKRNIIRALARIGDVNAISHFLKICRSKSLLHKNEFDSLKIEIFRTLHSYPAKTIVPLVEYGIHSNNKEVIEICKKLIDRYSLPVGKQEIVI